jgi:tetratricopeptide (TPR) repeat protein
MHMMRIARCLLYGCGVLGLATGLFACGADSRADRELSDAPAGAPDGGSAASSQAPATAGPADEGDPRAIRWQNAIRGLSFDTGRIVVESSGDDRAAAERHFAEAQAFMLRNDYVGAVGALRDTLAAWFDFPEAQRTLGDALRGRGRTAWAIASYRTYLDTHPDDADTRFIVSMELWGADQQADACTEMANVLAIDPTRAEAHERLAIWNYYMGDYAAAWEHVHGTRALGRDVPPQFIPLLEQNMPDPRPGGTGG